MNRIFINCIFLLCLCADLWPQSLVEPPYLHSFGIRKATQATLFLFLGPLAAFDDPQGIATAKMKSRDDPATPADDEVVVYGVNSGRNQLIYNTSMLTLATYGSRGSGDGQFSAPAGVAIDADGNVYVADCGNNRIVHLFNPGKRVRWAGSFTGKNGTDPGLAGPSQVAVDRRGRIYVADAGNRRIVAFTPNGAPCQVFPGGAQYRFEDGPEALAVADGSEPWRYFRGDRIVFCADKNGARLWKIGFAGDVQKQTPMPDGYHACYAAVDYYHNLWITDKARGCILKFDHNLDLLDIFGSPGRGRNQFVEPRGIAIWQRFGQVFVAEKQGAQYYWVGTDCTEKSLRKIGDNNYTLSLTLTEHSFVSLFGVNKDTTWILRKLVLRSGQSTIPFCDHARAPGGIGPMVLRIEPTYSSYTYCKREYPLQSGN
jgi:DNA-binding beta-propeller fold protein YncE